MNILQRSNYIIFFDNVRVDAYVINWNSSGGLFANDAMANITMFRTDAMDNWKAYLTQVKIFGENPFTKKFTLLFDGEIMNRSWSDSRNNMGQVTFHAKGFYHWLDIQIPLAIQSTDEYDPLLRFIYEAQNINIDEVRTLITSNSEVLLKDKSIEEIINQLFEKLTIGYYDVAEEDTAFAFAKVKERFKVMVEVLPEFREAGFLDLFSFTKTSQMNSFFVYLNEVLSQLMFEFYQDRDGTFRIKTPSWSDEVMKSHVIDSSLVDNITGLDDWENEPTRVLAIGGETQYNASLRERGMIADQTISNLNIPVGLYIGDPQDPENEEYYSATIQRQLADFGASAGEFGAGGAFNGEWFDNLTDQYKINSGHKSVNSSRPKHDGADYNLDNAPVYNIGTYGKVIKAGAHTTMGNFITIEETIDGQLYTFRYMHFSSPAIVKVGDSVSPGQRIGTSGATGEHVTGPHLHFEIWRGNADSGTSLNPDSFLRAKKGSGNSAAGSTGGPGGPQEITGSAAPTATTTTSAGTSLGGFEITAYTAFCDTGCIGITKEGWDVKDNTIDHRVIAVDPSVIPLGSIVEVGSFGLFNAVDTGGAIKGKRIDILVHNTQYAFKVGRQHNIPVKVLRSGYGDKSRVPKTKIGELPTWNGTSGSSTASSLPISRTYSSPYANVDGTSIGFKEMNYTGITKKTTTSSETTSSKNGGVDVSNPKPVTYSAKAAGVIPSYSAGYKAAIDGNAGGISPLLVTSVISQMSGWRENFSSSTHVGLMGISVKYTGAVLSGQNVMDADNNIEFGTTFLQAAMERFNNKVTYGLAAYYHGNLKDIEAVTLQIGMLDFSKTRDAFNTLNPGIVPFVDAVIAKYTSGTGNYIAGDPHVDFGGKVTSQSGQRDPGTTGDHIVFDEVESENSELPDYEASYKARLSNEEKKYKVNLARVEQALIRADSPAAATGEAMSADRLIYQYAKYTMQLHRARTHNINVSLTTCLPFLRPGYNAWIEPTRSDVICYITGIQHQGSFQAGCRTSITGGFVRDPATYQDIDSSIFIGETLATSSTFGDTIPYKYMDPWRDELSGMHGQQLTGEAHTFEPLKNLYSSHTGTGEYASVWNAEYTASEITEKITAAFDSAPAVVLERATEASTAITESEAIFVEKLLFTRHK